MCDADNLNDALECSESRFATVFRTAPDSVTINRLSDGMYVDVSESFSKIFGYTAEEVLGKTSIEIGIWFSLEDRAEFVAAVQAAGELRNYEAVLRHRDGHAVNVLISTSLIENDGEKCILTFTRDITDRKRIEGEMIDLMADLRRSNHDLQQFAYSASHDLQEPLRMVSIYTALLKKRYHGQLDADADDFIDFAVEGAQRMSRLLEDLLAYSRVGLIEDEPLEISSQRAVEGALLQLKSLIEETGALIEVGALPAVCANEMQLMRVFQNLIGNSLKFTAAGEVPRITIGAELAGDMWVFSVADEGIGIDPRWHEQVFVLFHRLNPRAEYPGTGFGLTLCKRIVERHGGSMWIESSDDHGTIMRFSLPTRC